MAEQEIGLGSLGFLAVNYDTASINTATVFAAKSASFSVNTDIQFYDHVIGLRDDDYTNFKDSKGWDSDKNDTNVNVGGEKPQKFVYRYAPKLPTASVNGVAYMEDDMFLNLISSAKRFSRIARVWVGYKNLSNGNKDGALLKSARISNMSFSVTAGDVVTYSVEFVATDFEDHNSDPNPDCRKLLTWDQFEFTTAVSTRTQSFSCTINNEIKPIYSLGKDNLLPKDIRAGMQSISGSIGAYSGDFATNFAQEDDLSIIVDGTSLLDLHVGYKPGEGNVESGPFVCNVPFVGIGSHEDNVWE